MRRFIMLLLGAAMILSLAACTPTTEKNKTGEVKETQGAMTATDKLPDMNAPDLTIVSIYSLGDDGKSLESHMEAVSVGEEDSYPLEDTLMYQLQYYDVISDMAWVMEYDPGEETETIGPGAENGDISYTGAVLDLMCFDEDLEDEMVRKAIALTYMENMNADSITIKIDGDDVASYTLDELH